MNGRLVARVAFALGLFVVLQVIFSAVDFEPHAVKLALLVALCAAAAGLVRDMLNDGGPGWRVRTVQPITPPGADHRLAAYVRLVEGHLTAGTVDRGLQTRLAILCDERLLRRHGLRRSDPAAEDLLGADLLRDLAAPPTRLTRARIDDYLRRIEEL